jgi:hypothetical protein
MTLEQAYSFVMSHGLEGVLMVWLWLERDERLSSQKELSSISKETTEALNGMKALLDQAVNLLHGKGR